MSLVEEEENTRQGHRYSYCFVFASISIIVTGWQEGHACMCSAKSHCTIHQRFSLRTGGRHDGNQQTRLSAKTDVKQKHTSKLEQLSKMVGTVIKSKWSQESQINMQTHTHTFTSKSLDNTQ